MPRLTQAGGTIDPDLLRQQEEEARRRQQQQAAAEAEASRPKKKKETAKPKPTRDPLAGIKEGLAGADQAIENFVEDKIYRPIMGEEGFKQWEQKKQAGEKRNAEAQDAFERAAYDGPVNTIGSEAVRTVIKAPVNLLEGVLNSAELVKDTVGTGINAIRGVKTPDNRNPFSNRYEEALYDLGVKGPKTQVGKVAEGFLTFGLGLAAIGRRLPQGLKGLGTGGTGVRGAVASGLVPGAMADLLLTKGNDGNLSQLVRDLDWIPPEYEDTVLLALATDSDDNIWVTKLKTMVEGGVLGAAADSIGALFKARKAAQAAKKAGKSDEAALQEGINVYKQASEEATTEAGRRELKEADRWAEVRGQEFDQLRADQEKAYEAADKILADFGEDSPEYADALKSLEEIDKAVSNFDWEEARRVDPEGLDPHERSAYTETADINDAAAAQMKAESGGVPRNAQVTPGAGIPGSTSPTMAGAPKVLTDAAYRIMNMDEGAERIVKDAIKKSDLDKVAKALRRSYKQVVRDAAQLVDDFSKIGRSADEATPLTDLLKGGTIKVNRGMGDETLLSAEGVVAVKALITDTANQIYDLTQNLDQMAEIRASGGNQYDRLIDRLVGLVELHKITGNFHGFNLGAFQESIFGAPRGFADKPGSAVLSVQQAKDWGMKIKKLSRSGDPQAAEELQKLTRAMLLAGGDPTKTATFFRTGLKIGTDNLLKGMYQSILSGPITHMRNLIGNTYATVERPLSVAINGYMTGDENLKRSAVAGFHAIRSSMGDAWKIAKVTFTSGEPVNINRKFVLEDAETLGTLEMMKKAAKNDAELRAVQFLEAHYHFLNNPWMSFPSRALMAADDFFKHLNARQRLASESMYKAVSDAKSPNDIDAVFNGYMKEFSKKIDPTTGEILDENLLDYANTATFQGEPWAPINTLSLFIGQVPIAKIFIPFLRTPANIMTYVGQHTPGLNRMLGSYKEVMRSGDKLAIAEMRGREAIGAFTIGSAGTLAALGMMTGNGPVDSEERAVWLKTHQPRSLRVGGKWISYESIEPLSTIMSAVSDVAMLAEMGNQSAAEKIAGQLVYAMTAAITEKSFLAGLTAISDVLDPSNLTNGSKVVQGLLTTTNNMLPMAGARRGLAMALDPYVKEIDNELQRALNAALPIYRNTQPTRTDVFTGKPIEALGGGVWNALVPFRVSEVNEDPVIDTMVDMQFEFNQMTKSGPKGEPLTAQEQATYSRLIYEAGLYDRIKNVMGKDWFQESLNEWKGRSGTLDKRKSRHYIAVDKIVSQVKSAAFRQMRAQDEDFANRIRIRQQAEVQARRGDVKGAVQRLQELPK